MARLRAEPFLLAMALTLAALSIAYLIVPGLSNLTPLLACAFLLTLLVQRLRSAPIPEPVGVAPVEDAPALLPASIISRWRVFLFLFLEAAVFLGIWFLPSSSAAHEPGFVSAAARYAVLLPPLVLLPWPAWLRSVRAYRAECLAALLALLTFFPHRAFMAAWPQYSQALGHAVYFLSRPFVAFLQYVPGATPTLAGPSLDVTILFGCSGLQAIKLFQILFALVLIVDWTRLNRRRALVGYAAGWAIALSANLVRIVLLVVLGNRLSPDLVIRLHFGAGWVFFAAVFSACLWLSYDWLCGRGSPLSASQEHSRLQVAPGAVE
ncbi:MAG: exosortase/archaeosortase family protein [Acidobacteriia bacterium]|nr:exosortase/archaeosortase family protein [Terriglobia bacterium]